MQDPETAKFTGMPIAAANAAQVDGILAPEDIAGELMKIEGTGVITVAPDIPISPSKIDIFYRLIQEKTGYRFQWHSCVYRGGGFCVNG